MKLTASRTWSKTAAVGRIWAWGHGAMGAMGTMGGMVLAQSACVQAFPVGTRVSLAFTHN
jgi:hypothetical protein